MTLKTTNISSPRHIIEPPLFLESLKPLFNGRVCAESFSLAESPGANGRKLAASYSYAYDGPRLLSADYAEASRSERPLSGIAAGSVSCQDPDYSVRYSWNPDGAPLSIRRHGLADRSVSSSSFPSLGGSRTLCSYGLVDDISLSWKGPRLDRADDAAEDCTLSIATDFSEKVRRDGEYAYDPDGRLTRDSNKGVTVSYNILGLPSLVCDGVNRIRRTYDSQGTLLRTEYGTERIEFTSPEPGQAGAIVATPVFDLARVADRCGPVEYADHTVERYIHEAGWIDADGRHVAAVRDCRGSLRATWTAHSALPPASGNSNDTNNSGSSGSALTLPGSGIGQVFPTGGNVYADLTAYYPFGLPFADWQGASRDLFSGKELERSGNLLDYDFHARRLDPQLLIFDKPDPLAANYPNLNPYLYCAANPVSLTDPSGMVITVFSEVGQFTWERLNKDVDDEWTMKDYYKKPYTGGSELVDAASNSLSEIMGSGDFGYSFIAALADDPDNNVIITFGKKSYAKNLNVFWDYNHNSPDDEHRILVENGFDYIPTINLVHELAHAKYNIDKGDNKTWFTILHHDEFGKPNDNNKAISQSELYTTHVENRIRADLGYPLRTFYSVIMTNGLYRGEGSLINKKTKRSKYIDENGCIHLKGLPKNIPGFKYK